MTEEDHELTDFTKPGYTGGPPSSKGISYGVAGLSPRKLAGMLLKAAKIKHTNAKRAPRTAGKAAPKMSGLKGVGGGKK